MTDLKIEVWDIDKIIPYPDNNKIHSDEQIEVLAHALKKGWDQPIVVDKDGSIIKGHGRRLAAIRNGMKKVPVIVRRDMSPTEVRAARIADNKIADLSGFDDDAMRREIMAIAEDEPDMSSIDMGYGSDDALLAFLSEPQGDPSIELLDDDESSVDSSAERESKLPKEADYVRAYQIVVECKDEADQGKAYEMMVSAGYKVRALEA